MLIVYESNRQERLAEALTEVLATPLASPLVPEIVAVQSIGMARWLTLWMARRFGVVANVQFPFPAALLWRLFRVVLPGVPERSPFAADVLTWRVLGALPEALAEPSFQALAEYLRGGDDLRQYQLAERIALLFDEYLVYRPDWVVAWEDGKADHWQARLWRRMTSGRAVRHRVRLAQEFVEALRRGQSAVPARISVFGLTSLPPAHLDLFAAIAKWSDVHLYLLNPCQEYWAAIRDERAIARQAVHEEPERLYLESGNSLLASFGKQTRELFDRIQDLETSEHALFEDPGEECLLHAIQSDILHLRNRGNADAEATALAVNDRSIQVHSCHSPVREVEILHDQLLALLDADRDLTPADILVTMPDLGTYGSTVEAVFGTAAPACRLPYRLAGRRASGMSPLVRAFFGLLDLPESRFEASRVVALLEADAVRRRFGILESDLDLIRDWLRETGVRWGVDAEDRATRGLPPVDDHTWRAGLDRLLLGYALPGDGARVFDGILPHDGIEGENAATAGRLTAFAEALFDAAEELTRQRSVPAWVARLRGLVADFFDGDAETEGERGGLLAAITSLEDNVRQAEFAGEVSLRVVRSCLVHLVETGEGRAPLAAGAVTFCDLVSARGIPAKVVCVIGMNDGAFPRVQRTPTFDLIQEAPRSGDRSRRHGDRALFLEALLAARRVFYVSYVGQHIRENTPLPPSVLVSELVDYVERGFRSADSSRSIREHLVTRHPLQPFSPRYFAGTGTLFSYAADLCEASRTAAGVRSERLPLLRAPLPEPSSEWRRVDIDQFMRFFSQPVRYLIRERLGVRLEDEEGRLEDREPFTLDGLAGYRLRHVLLNGRLHGRPVEETHAVIRAAGLLPHGIVGDVLLRQEAVRVERFAERLSALRPAEGNAPVPVDLDLGPVRLRGQLTDLGPRGRFVFRLGATRVKDRMALWIHHLLLSRLAPGGVVPESRWLGEDASLRLAPVPDADAQLRRLARLYWTGVSRVLPLVPDTSYAYAAAFHENGSRTAAMTAARKVWEENEYTGRGEETDPYHRLAFRDRDPLDQEFATLAEEVFVPLLTHQEAV